MKIIHTVIFFFANYLICVDSSYLPVSTPVNYCNKNEATCKSDVKLYMNELNTDEAAIPYENNHFDFCLADNESKSPVENLGQVLFGEHIRPSPYTITFMKNESFRIICKKSYSGDRASDNFILSTLKEGIILNYRHNWIVDNMPVIGCTDFDDYMGYCASGSPIGCYIQSDRQTCITVMSVEHGLYLFNHVDFKITYQSRPKEEWGNFSETTKRIISVKAIPKSIDYGNLEPESWATASVADLKLPSKFLKKGETFNITYTYSVTFIEDNNLQWSSRWNNFLKPMPVLRGDNIQWFSILNSLVMVLIVSGILLSQLHKDFTRYNQVEKGTDTQKEFGWKLVHGDVFRPPQKGMLLSVLLGSGVQVLGMTLATLCWTCMGFSNSVTRGTLITYAVFSYAFLGWAAGAVSARMYKTFGGEKWKLNALLTSVLATGTVYCLFYILNLVLWVKDSSAAVPSSTLLIFLALWWLGSVPLTFVGAFFGHRKQALQYPIPTNRSPRLIPKQPIHFSLFPSMIMGGVLPFGCIFIQLYFILHAIWDVQTYYMFASLFVTFIILIITCAEVTILLCYFHLRTEDYQWWWRSYLTSGFATMYLFIYFYYFFMKLVVYDAASTFLYFGYTLIIAFLFNLVTGTVGFFACFFFLRKIYSVIKVELVEPEFNTDIYTISRKKLPL